MVKTISLGLCLLISVIFAGVPAQAANYASPYGEASPFSCPKGCTLFTRNVATASTVPHTQLIAQQGLAKIIPHIVADLPPAKATLTLQDLPPGFTALPREIATVLSSRLDSLRQQLGQGNFKPDNFFAFVSQQNFQMVLGFTGKIPSPTEQASFDTSVKQLQQPEAQQRMVSQLQESLKGFGGIKVTEYKGLPQLNNLANVSTGITLGLELRGQPLRVDFAAFRRNNVGAFTAVMYGKGRQPAIALGNVAHKLDSRIEQVSASGDRSPVAITKM